MLELNKEYTYREICNVLNWSVCSGNSKKAQIKELEAAYEFLHPINPKTHKEKKSYIFTKKKKPLIRPSKHNSGGANNTKTVQPMMKYILEKSASIDGEYHSITAWLCDILELMNKEIYNISYMEDDEIAIFCEKNNIQNIELTLKYLTDAKSILKKIFLGALSSLQKKNLIEHKEGYIFIYKVGVRSKGFVSTDALNDIIKENEEIICNVLNEEYLLSKKMQGRQLLLLIYGNKEYVETFNQMKIEMLMKNAEALTVMNDYLKESIAYPMSIDEEHSLINYYKAIQIGEINSEEACNLEELGTEICNTIRKKTKTKTFDKKNQNYTTFDSLRDIETIEKLLFVFFDENLDKDTTFECIDFFDSI